MCPKHGEVSNDEIVEGYEISVAILVGMIVYLYRG
jgi:hypothetical protein